MKKLKQKLKNRSGETIGEVLVALLISALALMMLAGAISSSTGLIKTGKDKMNQYYNANNELFSYSNSGLTVSIAGKTVSGQTTMGSQTISGVSYGVNSTLGSSPVIAYKKS